MSDVERIAFSLAETAAMFGVTVQCLRDRITKGEIAPIRMGRKVLIPKPEIDRLLAGGAVDA